MTAINSSNFRAKKLCET